MLANNTFLLSTVAKISNNSSLVNLLADLSSSTMDNISTSILELTNKLQNSIYIEVIIASYLVLIWVFVMLISIFYIYMLLFQRKKTRIESGQVYIINPVTKNFRGNGFQPNTTALLYKYPVNETVLYTI